MRCVGHVAVMQVRRNTCRNFVMKSEGKRLFERDGHRWEIDVIIDLKCI
jgi:hypothetical protein